MSDFLSVLWGCWREVTCHEWNRQTRLTVQKPTVSAHKMCAWNLTCPHKTHAACTWERADYMMGHVPGLSCYCGKHQWYNILLCPASSCLLLWQLVHIGACHGTAARFRHRGRTGFSDKRVPDGCLKWGLCSASEGQWGPWFLELVAEILCNLFFFHRYVIWIVESSHLASFFWLVVIIAACSYCLVEITILGQLLHHRNWKQHPCEDAVVPIWYLGITALNVAILLPLP